MHFVHQNFVHFVLWWAWNPHHADCNLAELPSGSQTWQGEMDHLSMIFLLRSQFIGVPCLITRRYSCCNWVYVASLPISSKKSHQHTISTNSIQLRPWPLVRAQDLPEEGSGMSKKALSGRLIAIQTYKTWCPKGRNRYVGGHTNSKLTRTYGYLWCILYIYIYIYIYTLHTYTYIYI